MCHTDTYLNVGSDFWEGMTSTTREGQVESSQVELSEEQNIDLIFFYSSSSLSNVYPFCTCSLEITKLTF